jgi:hypothetical protein
MEHNGYTPDDPSSSAHAEWTSCPHGSVGDFAGLSGFRNITHAFISAIRHNGTFGGRHHSA